MFLLMRKIGNMNSRCTLALTAVLGGGLLALPLPREASAQILGTADSFGVLAGSTVTNTGPSVIMGNVGAAPGNAIVGFPPGIVLPPGTIHAGDAVAATAQVDLATAYTTLQALPSQFNLTGQNLGGMVLLPAIYSFATSAQLTGVLTLNGLGNPAAQFVFQIGSTLTTASNSAVLLINGANGNNVYWAVGSSATLGTNSVFAGNIVALTSITLNTGATITCGRALARNGAVTLDNNTITLCAPTTGGTGGTGGTGTDITQNTLFGEGTSGAQQTAFGASGLFGSILMSEAMVARDGTPDLTGISSRPMKIGVLAEGSSTDVTGDYLPSTWRLWTTGFGGRGSFEGSAVSGSSALDTRTAGFAVGLDYQIDRTALFGIAAGYTYSQFSVDQLTTRGNVEGAHLGLYGLKRFGAFYLAATAEYAHFKNSTERSVDWVLDERTSGSFDSEAFSARVEAGWKRSIGRHWVTPFAGVQFSHLMSDGFTEGSVGTAGTPGLLGLTFGSNSVNSLASSLGIQVDTRLLLPGGQTLSPFARVAWVHEFSPDRGISAILTSSPEASFSPVGASAAEDVAKVKAGARLDVTQNTGLFLAFDGEFSGHTQSYAGTGGLKVTW